MLESQFNSPYEQLQHQFQTLGILVNEYYNIFSDQNLLNKNKKQKQKQKQKQK